MCLHVSEECRLWDSINRDKGAATLPSSFLLWSSCPAAAVMVNAGVPEGLQQAEGVSRTLNVISQRDWP